MISVTNYINNLLKSICQKKITNDKYSNLKILLKLEYPLTSIFCFKYIKRKRYNELSLSEIADFELHT